MSPRVTPVSVLIDRHILVLVGSGGVGKTTLAAATGLAAARRGRRALVITIDPARRLADALDVGELGGAPTAVPRARLDALGVPPAGQLSAMMLDMKRSFDDLVERFAESPEVRDRIFANRIYQHVSDALAGSAEYSAMEKVHEMASSPEFDLVVVDTPPSQHALDFLDAPQRLLEFLDSRIVQLLLHPAFAAGRFGVRLFQRSTHRVLQLLERISGVSFLEEISEFLLAFEGMSAGFRERARAVRARLLGPECAFVLVSGPAAESAAHAELMLSRLDGYGVPLAGVVANRVRVWPDAGTPPADVPNRGDEIRARAALAEALAKDAPDGFPADDAAQAAIAATSLYAAIVRADARAMAPLRTGAERRGQFFRAVPELPRDVHDLEALDRVANELFAEPGREARRAGQDA